MATFWSCTQALTSSFSAPQFIHGTLSDTGARHWLRPRPGVYNDSITTSSTLSESETFIEYLAPVTSHLARYRCG